ncbi:MAG: IS200/IS605 family transposase [Cyanobacteria bacterium J06639_1]
MNDDFVSSGRAVSDLKAHLVLTTKYRRKVLTESMIERLQELCCNHCYKWECKPIEVNGEEDYIHLLFQYYPQLELPKFVGNIKSVTSRRIRDEYPERVAQFYSKAVLWNEAYFIASCGGVTISRLREYVQSQGRKDRQSAGR